MKKIFNKKEYFKADNAGFTLIELILSMAIVVILSASVVQVVRISDTQKGLNLAASELRGAIRLAQASSLTMPFSESDVSADENKRHLCGFGLRVNSTTKYVVFYNYVTQGEMTGGGAHPCRTDISHTTGGSSPSQATQAFTLPEGMRFPNNNVGRVVFFSSPYGEMVNPAGGNHFIIKNSKNDTLRVDVNSRGKID